MRKEEQRIWDTMKNNAPDGAWMERVENLVGNGMPDIWVGGEGGHCWVELKAAVVPVRPTTPLLGSSGLRQSQINWHKKAAQRAIPVYTLIRDDKGGLYLLGCDRSEEINAMPRGHMRVASLAASWTEIFARLLN